SLYCCCCRAYLFCRCYFCPCYCDCNCAGFSEKPAKTVRNDFSDEDYVPFLIFYQSCLIDHGGTKHTGGFLCSGPGAGYAQCGKYSLHTNAGQAVGKPYSCSGNRVCGGRLHTICISASFFFQTAIYIITPLQGLCLAAPGP